MNRNEPIMQTTLPELTPVEKRLMAEAWNSLKFEDLFKKSSPEELGYETPDQIYQQIINSAATEGNMKT